jgi:hypothetical protein
MICVLLTQILSHKNVSVGAKLQTLILEPSNRLGIAGSFSFRPFDSLTTSISNQASKLMFIYLSG